MAFNTVGQYTGNHKAWDHVGNILPNVEHSEGERPSIEWKVAEWLPVQFFDKHYENWIVLTPGKVVACDPDGRLCPAGMKIAAELVGTGDVLTYTLNDVSAGVINVATGSPVTLAELTDTGSTRGYTVTEIDAAGFLGESGRAFTVSNPVGVAPFAYLQSAGGDGSNPTQYRQHNYNMQHLVTVLCDYVLELPLVPASTTSEALTFDAPVDNVACLSGGNLLSNLPVAANTQRTPISFTGGEFAIFSNQVDSMSDVEVAGDWSIDLDSGAICVYSTDTVSGVSANYSHYAAAPAAVSVFASAVGNLKCGDLVTFDANSNLRLASAANLYIGDTSGGDESANIARSHGLIIGQVLDRDSGHPKDYLDRVRTAYSPPIGTDASGALPGYLGQMDEMPGSATGGAPSNVHYAGAADTVVRVNLTRF